MAVRDLLTALPGILLVGMLPGFALATACAPRWGWWERLAAAPGLAAGFVGGVGLLERRLDVPFEPATVVPAVAVVVGIAVARRRRVARSGDGAVPPRGLRVVVATALAAGAVGAGAVAWGLRGQPLPYTTDAPVHASIATEIARHHDVIPVVPEPVDGGYSRPRGAFEATAALVSQLGGPSATATIVPLTLLAVLLLPLGIAALALALTRSAAVAALTAALSATMPFPSFPLVFGELPLIVDSTLVVALVLGGWRALREPRRLDGPLIVGAAAAAVWAVHGSEVITAVVVAGPLLLGVVVRERPRGWVRGGATAAALGLAGVGAVSLLLRAPVIAAAPAAAPGAAPVRVASGDLFATSIADRSLVDAIFTYTHFMFPNALLLGLAVVGVGVALLERRQRWAVAALAVMLACFFDLEVTGVLRRVWVQLFPWSGSDRLMSIQYFVLPMLMAIGAVGVGSAVAARLRERAGLVGGRAALRAGAVTAVAALVTGAVSTGQRYADAAATEQAATGADVTVLQQMAERLPAGAVVLNDDASDAGVWIGPLTPQVAMFSEEHFQVTTSDSRSAALFHACQDPAAAARAVAGVDAVFVGSRRLPGSPQPWDIDCVSRIPNLRMIASATDGDARAAAFVVVPG